MVSGSSGKAVGRFHVKHHSSEVTQPLQFARPVCLGQQCVCDADAWRSRGGAAHCRAEKSTGSADPDNEAGMR